MSFTETEQEIIVLKAVWEMIGDLVNYEMFEKNHGVSDAQLMFRTMTHQRLFNILLVDFLSPPNQKQFGLPFPPQGAPKSDNTSLYYLRRVCENPKLNVSGDAIRAPLDAFAQWLEGDCHLENLWLPSIDVETPITVKRIVSIKICGNIAKHSFSRLSRIVEDIGAVLSANGHPVDMDQSYLVIPEFYEWFHTHVLNYHASAIAEFLNNIRWGIYEYLGPEFKRSFWRGDPFPPVCGFHVPTDCQRPMAISMHEDLMNAVRSPPYMPKFEVTKWLKLRF